MIGHDHIGIQIRIDTMMRNICPKLFGDLPHLRQAHFSHYHISAENGAIAGTDGEEISTEMPLVC